MRVSVQAKSFVICVRVQKREKQTNRRFMLDLVSRVISLPHSRGEKNMTLGMGYRGDLRHIFMNTLLVPRELTQ